MAPRTKTLPRTLQYWRLDNGQSATMMAETDWQRTFAKLHGRPLKQTIDGQEVTGTVVSLPVSEAAQVDMRTSDAPGAPEIEDRSTTYGVILAGNKDYVPNQQDRDTGDQQAMALAGENWDPVDNLFAWFCPFGNMFGVISESVSSPRPTIFAEWLTRTLLDERLVTVGSEHFSLEAEPVIDRERAAYLNHASGLKSMVVAGNLGTLVNDATGMEKLFLGRGDSIGALRIEIKVSTVRSVSSEQDERTLLDFYNETFGALEGDVMKAQVKTAGDQQADIPPTEIDLLHHRLTRSTNVRLTNGATRAFEALSTIRQIVSAFGQDRKDLLRIRNELEELK